MRSLRDLLHQRPIQGDQIAWLSLDYLNLYRLFVAMLYTGLFFTPVMVGAYPSARLYAAKAMAIVFLIVSPGLFVLGRRLRRMIDLQAAAGLTFDLVFNLLMFRIMGGLDSGVGVLLAGAMGAAGAIFALRTALAYASIAGVVILWQAVVDVASGAVAYNVVVPHGLLGATYFATALLGAYLGNRARESRDMLRIRSEDVANLATLNEMIIERMRTGILIIDPKNNTHIMNDSAWYLMGMPRIRNGKLFELAPNLVKSLTHWRECAEHIHHSVRLAHGAPPVVPRFARLGAQEPSDALVFLEDTSMVSRRAQELTLSSLGRLSASIAHEIRNPLAAISHSAQLLAESETMTQPDHKLTDIINRHCVRMNDIIENVLQLARQEPARPKVVRLDQWIETFRSEFVRLHDLGRSSLEIQSDDEEVQAQVDPLQLQQVIWNLCQNAIKYGKSDDGAAHVALRAGYVEQRSGPFVEVADQGAGIEENEREQIFQPFFTSSSDGTGLGLYLCQQLCMANQASIEYLNGDDGGSIFRIHLTAARVIADDEKASEAESREDSAAS